MAAAALAAVFGIAACGHEAKNPASVAADSGNAAAAQPISSAPQNTAEAALPPSQTGGFDGHAAYDFTAKLVSFGPRPPASDALHRTQDYIISQLQSFGCAVEQHDFHASTPIGELAMKNITAKIPGTGPGIILLLTHYDTLRMDNFVGAVDGGSSTGLMLEMARLLCAQKEKQPNAVWIVFLAGEEALVNWYTNHDNTYGSRELAAGLANSGELKRVRAVLLADMVGPKNLKIRRDSNSTRWLADLVWKTAARLGYKDIFVNDTAPVADDHTPFVQRNVPSVDIIDLDDYPYWHTTQDTMDKVSPRSLGIAGHVFVASLAELQEKFH
ncbi:MAG: M28 family peptidase [Candidatus Binataceae bacterium]